MILKYMCKSQIPVDDSLKMTRFPGGYFTPDGGVYYNVTDYQGNVCKVVRSDGTVCQTMDYYPYGEPFSEWNWDLAEMEKGMSSNRYLYSGNERETGLGVNQYDFQARTYVASFPRFSSIDPKASSYAGFSPYLFSNGDPVNNTDPNGRSTQVKQTGANTYEVIGGDLDGDLNVYLYTPDEDGNYTVKGNSIGLTLTETSFFNSDTNSWKNGSIIDLSDTSGQEFLTRIMDDTPYLEDYALNAQNDHPYDFKSTNGTNEKVYSNDQYQRGMVISVSEDGHSQIASARDVGNVGAGYVAAANGLPYKVARKLFDAYQGMKSGEFKEGITSTSAQRIGYNLGIRNTTSLTRMLRLVNTPHHIFFRF